MKKKIIAASLALLLVLAMMPTVALAEGTPTTTNEDSTQRYTVTFRDYDGTVLGTDTVDRGAAATAPADPDNWEGYHFSGWDADFSAVTEDLTVTALYAEIEIIDDEEVPNMNGATTVDDEDVPVTGAAGFAWWWIVVIVGGAAALSFLIFFAVRRKQREQE